MKKFIKNIVLLLFCLSLTNVVSAVDIVPARLDLTINRGATQEVIITLGGSVSTKPENLTIFATDISMLQNGSLIFDRLEGFKYSAVPWIKLKQTNYILLEKQKKKLKFKISVPINTVPGEYYSLVMVEPTEFDSVKTEIKSVTLMMRGRVGILIIINVPGRIYEKKGNVVSASVKKINGKLKVFSTFNNSGNIHLDVSGSASIRSKDGRNSFGRIKLIAIRDNKEKSFVFPGNMRDFEGILDKQLPKGEYEANIVFDYGNKARKATFQSAFSINQEVNIDESKARFLVVDKKIDMQVPVGGSKTKAVKILNNDYRPINVSFISNSWIKIEPKSLTIEPGQSKNVKLIVSNNDKSSKKTTIIVKPDRGLVSEIKLLVEEKSKITKKITKKERSK